MKVRYIRVALPFLVAVAAGCRPGYMKASELADKGQGPDECSASCRDLGMEMGALVLVSDQLPACVCQPQAVRSPAHGSQSGASGTAPGYVVIAAAAAARQRQIQQQQQQRARQPITSTQ